MSKFSFIPELDSYMDSALPDDPGQSPYGEDGDQQAVFLKVNGSQRVDC